MGAAPYWFMCPHERSWRNTWRHVPSRARPQRQTHTITLTGRTRPNPSNTRGRRTSDTEREYRCSCGHVGWSRHKDLERMAGRAQP